MKKVNYLLGLLGLIVAVLLTACSTSDSNKTSSTASSSSGNTAQARTLSEIKESGKIKIGVFSDKKPFGYVDEHGDYQGYDVYFANRLAKDLKVDVEYVAVDPASRVEYLTSAKVDIILANFTVTDERAKQVDFALPYMKVALGVVSPSKSLIESVEDLKEKP